MAKITLGKKPKNFEHIVKFKLLDGTEGLIPVVYKYRTRKEFGAFIDSLNADRVAAEDAAKEADRASNGEAAGAAVEPVQPVQPIKPEEFSMAKFMDDTIGKNGQYILAVVDSWGLDIELSLESAQELANTYPGGAATLMEDYRSAIQEGRLGN